MVEFLFEMRTPIQTHIGLLSAPMANLCRLFRINMANQSVDFRDPSWKDPGSTECTHPPGKYLNDFARLRCQFALGSDSSTLQLMNSEHAQVKGLDLVGAMGGKSQSEIS
jgi:hypothetical protein